MTTKIWAHLGTFGYFVPPVFMRVHDSKSCVTFHVFSFFQLLYIPYFQYYFYHFARH